MSASSWSLDLSSETGVLGSKERVYFSSLVVLTVKLIGGASSDEVGSSVVAEAIRLMSNVGKVVAVAECYLSMLFYRISMEVTVV